MLHIGDGLPINQTFQLSTLEMPIVGRHVALPHDNKSNQSVTDSLTTNLPPYVVPFCAAMSQAHQSVFLKDFGRALRWISNYQGTWFTNNFGEVDVRPCILIPIKSCGQDQKEQLPKLLPCMKSMVEKHCPGVRLRVLNMGYVSPQLRASFDHKAQPVQTVAELVKELACQDLSETRDVDICTVDQPGVGTGCHHRVVSSVFACLKNDQPPIVNGQLEFTIIQTLMHELDQPRRCEQLADGRQVLLPVVTPELYKLCSLHYCVPFFGEFTRESCAMFLQHHEALVAQAREEIKMQSLGRCPCRPIVITWVIDSPGGDTSALTKIIDSVTALRAFNAASRASTRMPIGQIEISAVALTMAASCGAIMLALASKNRRYITEHCQTLFHQPCQVAEGGASSINAQGARDTAFRLGDLGEHLYCIAEGGLLGVERTDDLIRMRQQWFNTHRAVLASIKHRNPTGYASRCHMDTDALEEWLQQKADRLLPNHSIVEFLMLEVYENNTDHFLSSKDMQDVGFAVVVDEIIATCGKEIIVTHEN